MPTQEDARQFPRVPLDGVTELRIHGVSGTPPESMLGDPHPVQVWGDGTAGFYRRANHASAGADHLEAYSWGGLTAGSATRAAWLLLLPFMLVNVASWAHPPRPGRRSATVGTMSGAIRVLGLTLTLTLVISVAFLTMDLVAWQCAGAAAECGDEHWYSRLLTPRAPAVRIALGALPVVAVVVAVRWLSKSTSKRYEEWRDESAPPPADDSDDLPRGVWDMSHPNFWHGKGPFTRLRSLHVTACWTTVAALVAYAASTVAEDGRRTLGRVLAALAAALLAPIAAALASPFSGRRRDLIEGRPPHRLYCRAVMAGPYVAAGLLAAAFLYALTLPAPASATATTGALPGLHTAKNALVVAQLVAFVALVAGNAAALRGRGGQPAESTYGLLLGGWAASLLAALGVMLAGAFAAGLTLRYADYLGCPADCRDPASGTDAVAFVLPDVYESTARGFVFVAVAALLAGAYVWFVVRRRAAARALGGVAAEYPPDCTDEGRRRAIAGVHATAALTDHAAWPLAGVVAAGAVGAALGRYLPDGLATDLTNIGAWLVGIFALGLVALGYRAYGSPAVRRTVGILWDLGTFWPRAVHPFAPPCYCERTVPEFTRRIEQLRDSEPDSGVVVSAHSQGSVIAIATLLRLRRDPACVALLTYGSPLQRLYARAFPHFFGLPVLDHVRATYGSRWTNLYRRSDPIGGPVACADADVPQPDGPDRRLRDPVFQTDPYAFTPPPAYGHSHYFADPAFVPCVERLADQVCDR